MAAFMTAKVCQRAVDSVEKFSCALLVCFALCIGEENLFCCSDDTGLLVVELTRKVRRKYWEFH